MLCLWRAVDQEGRLPENYVTRTHGKSAAFAFIKRALEHHGSPEATRAGGLQRDGAPVDEQRCRRGREIGRWAKNRLENNGLPFRRR
ncbi:DDE-type integrase/transposase/recombinase [Sphingomonas sanguinis]|uniref:DDE-type integrase/transposase/recombinase n=1 Tax=Sphingomonas sanguinis TaxID=33051 RepID=A0ABU5LPU4_9SPHN|nr:DDE-type integrase/transposase/recombinase [Sphingomonas sanguinis]MDZ7281949.1 DDE-type integrase/transposase/recombinase [Sphingomonas sanguinis]